MNESIISSSLNHFKKNWSSYLAVGFLCGLFLVLVSTLSFLDELLFLLAVPLFAFPFLFASHICCYLLGANQPITLSNFFRYFISFFRPQFRSSFRGIISFLKSLAVYFGVLIISYLTMYFVFKNQYGDVFVTATENLVKDYMSGNSYDELVKALEANDGLLLTFITYVSSIPIPFMIITFIYLVSFSSLSIYYRANINSGAPSLIRLAVANAYARYRRAMRKDWFKLNYLLIVLPIVGVALGTVLYIFIIKHIYYLSAILTVSVFVPLVFFLPFYFSNMEVLYTRYENVFKEGNKMAIETVLNRIQSSIELSEEEKRRIEESFKSDDEKKE